MISADSGFCHLPAQTVDLSSDVHIYYNMFKVPSGHVLKCVTYSVMINILSNMGFPHKK